MSTQSEPTFPLIVASPCGHTYRITAEMVREDYLSAAVQFEDFTEEQARESAARFSENDLMSWFYDQWSWAEVAGHGEVIQEPSAQQLKHSSAFLRSNCLPPQSYIQDRVATAVTPAPSPATPAGYFVDWNGNTRRTERPGGLFRCTVNVEKQDVDVHTSDGCVVHECTYFPSLEAVRAVGVEVLLIADDDVPLSANDFARDNLSQLAAELTEWRKTGSLPQGARMNDLAFLCEARAPGEEFQEAERVVIKLALEHMAHNYGIPIDTEGKQSV